MLEQNITGMNQIMALQICQLCESFVTDLTANDDEWKDQQ